MLETDGPTGLMLGDALPRDKADAGDLLRACLRASACQVADESSVVERRMKPNLRRKAMVKFKGYERLTGTDGIVNDSSTRARAS